MSATPEMLEPSAKPGLVVVPKSPATPDSMPDINIIDIRRDGIEVDLKKEILSSLKPKHGPKTMPTLLLYDERGLQIFEKAGDIIAIGSCTDQTRLPTWKNTI